MAKIARVVYRVLTEEWRKFVRYVVAGLISVSINIGLLYSLTEFAGLWYLFSSTIAFVIAVVVSFTLQKFWAFKEHSTDELAKQASIFISLALLNLAFNAGLMYTLVELVFVPYILAQIIVGALIALWSFFAYHFLIFKRTVL